jgi:ATP adenylyltransferase
VEQLWAPWRLSYVSRPAGPPSTTGDECFICRGLAECDDRQNLILVRTPYSCVILNRYPYNNGHLLVAPRVHRARLDELTSAETQDLQNLLALMIQRLEATIHPDGFNVGLNLGRVAGAGLPGHLHWHLVPRWSGDTNFMPIISDTKVIVQSLESLYDLLRASLDCGGEFPGNSPASRREIVEE